jgi:hypothetical protein
MMNKSIANTVRTVFALFLLGLGMYVGAENVVAHELAARGLSTCGSAANPCALTPLTVTVQKSTGRFVTYAAEGGKTLGSAAANAMAARPGAMAES